MPGDILETEAAELKEKKKERPCMGSFRAEAWSGQDPEQARL